MLQLRTACRRMATKKTTVIQRVEDTRTIHVVQGKLAYTACEQRMRHRGPCPARAELHHMTQRHAGHVAAKKSRTQHDYKRVLDKYFLPELAKTRLVKITYEKITGITDKLSETPSEQAHALAVARD